MRAVVLLVLLIVVPVTVRAQDNPACALPPRLVVGEEGRVTGVTLLNVRAEPGLSGAKIGHMDDGGMFTVLDGPTCADGYNWWQIDYHHVRDGVTGWAAEGDPSDGEYWTEPRGTRVLLTDSEGRDRYFVAADDGSLEPEGCWRPPDDYTQQQIGYATLNTRTLAMLDHAYALYAAMGGTAWPNFRYAMTQGSYTTSEPASFGTHDGGGAVDLSVRNPADWNDVLTDEIPIMVEAMRQAGFAAWLRDTGILYPNSPIHIHAIALGDAELSPAARLQIDGTGGYLSGFDGLPPADGGPHPDASGGPVVCRWMESLGYAGMPPLPTLESVTAG